MKRGESKELCSWAYKIGPLGAFPISPGACYTRFYFIVCLDDEFSPVEATILETHPDPDSSNTQEIPN